MFNITRGRSGLGAGITAALALAVALTCLSNSPADAARRHHHHSQIPAGATDPAKDAALIVDGVTGKVLYARNENAIRHPASLTKMMTLYMLFDALKKGQLTLASRLPISAHAAAQRPTNLHLGQDDAIDVDTAIKAVVVRSANDVAVAIAEALGGTETHFAEMMTAKARALGMRNTFYHNASGLPDNLQITTAGDQAILARHLAYDFPQYFYYFSTPSLWFRGREYITHDNLIGRYRGADGIKTGYTGASGFNLVSSVVRGNIHVIGVVMGGRTAHRRDREMVRLLDNTFAAVVRNPVLVARAQVPWQTVAMYNAPSPNFNLPTAAFSSAFSVPTSPVGEGDDEDTAESRVDDSDLDTDAGPPEPPPAATAVAKPPITVAATAKPPAVTPQPKPPAVTPQPKPLAVVASLRPTPVPTRPAAQPALRPVILGDTNAASALSLHDWTIQIGAFTNFDLARTQLAAYAEQSMDILGQAQRIVVPFQSIDGQLLYRARFGPFLEREARQICARLTERGQTCFAAISTR